MIRRKRSGSRSQDQLPTELEADRKIVDRGVEALIRSGGGQRMVSAGEIAPTFALPDQSGLMVHLSKLLTRGPAVVVFFRGGWCDHCREDLLAIEHVAASILERGASVVAISPQTPASHARLAADLHLSYPLLSDEDGKTSASYRLRWELPEDLAAAHLRLGAELDLAGSGTQGLPVPGRFVIASTGVIAYADVDPDYTRRPAPSELLPVLDVVRIRRTNS